MCSKYKSEPVLSKPSRHRDIFLYFSTSAIILSKLSTASLMNRFQTCRYFERSTRSCIDSSRGSFLISSSNILNKLSLIIGRGVSTIFDITNYSEILRTTFFVYFKYSASLMSKLDSGLHASGNNRKYILI